MHNLIVIVENTRVHSTYKVIKILYLSVLNDDNTVVHQICKISTVILGTYSELILVFIKSTKIIIIKALQALEA